MNPGTLFRASILVGIFDLVFPWLALVILQKLTEYDVDPVLFFLISPVWAFYWMATGSRVALAFLFIGIFALLGLLLRFRHRPWFKELVVLLALGIWGMAQIISLVSLLLPK